MTDDLRRTELTAWARQQLSKPDAHVEVASADASFRRYFRVSFAETGATHSRIVMDAPPDKEDVQPFIKVAGILQRADVNSPRVLAVDLARGYLLLTDLGSQTYLAQLNANKSVANAAQPDLLYRDACHTLLNMQLATHRDAQIKSLPAYDQALLHREMELFPEWFLQRHLGLQLDQTLRAQLDFAFKLLCESALAQPQVFVHRDYHSRNLMFSGSDSASGHMVPNPFGPNPGVLDFQDAVVGPITYDLVSLLRDCYIEWPLDQVQTWALQYLQQAQTNGLAIGVSQTHWLRWFDLMGVQRHLKAVGIFARLWHRDGKSGYLNDIPRTLGYISSVARQYPELGDFVRLLDSQVMPALSASVAASVAR
jgi:N-acetylmuramate 1-kinase